jgi:hypothetical protein
MSGQDSRLGDPDEAELLSQPLRTQKEKAKSQDE